MQQMKTQGAKARRLMAFILFTFFAAGPVFGQTGPSERVQIPFEFTFGSKVLPAGTYAFSVDNFGLKMESATGEGFHARIISRLGGPTEFLRDGSLVFDKTGGVRILSEVWILGTDGILLHSTPSNHTHEILPFFTPLGPNVLEGWLMIARAPDVMAGPVRVMRKRTNSSKPQFRGSALQRCKASRMRS